MSKKSIVLVGCLLMIFVGSVVFPVNTWAQNNSLLFGQKQKYSAVVRSDGKVIVYGKIILDNSSKKDITQTSFTVPKGVAIDNLSVYQITLPERCTSTQKETTQSTTSSLYGYGRSCQEIERDVFETGGGYYYYYDSGSDDALVYKDVKLGKDNGTYTLALSDPIKPQKQGAYLVAYSVDEGYVTEQFGLYTLSFKTLQVPDSVKEVQVGVDLSSDLYSKEKPSNIEDGSAKLEDVNLASGVSKSDSSMTNEGLDKLQSNIGQGGVFIKTGKGLLPNESFVVNGEFADAAWKLQIGWIIGGIVGFIVAGVLMYVLFRKASEHEFEPVSKSKKG